MIKDKILVTGAGGEVGSISNKIIIKLRAEGINVRSFLRKGNKYLSRRFIQFRGFKECS